MRAERRLGALWGPLTQSKVLRGAPRLMIGFFVRHLELEVGLLSFFLDIGCVQSCHAHAKPPHAGASDPCFSRSVALTLRSDAYYFSPGARPCLWLAPILLFAWHCA